MPALGLIAVRAKVDTGARTSALHARAIETVLSVGDRSWPADVTFTNRESMTFRMLLGRSGISSDVFDRSRQS
ncbi:MAG: hypothetical protein AAGJ32_03705 [Pseudomonadota bacterium]